MRKILLATAIALLTLMPLRASAATAGEFHASLLRRGITAYEAGRHQDAVKNLRLAAFGFVEAIEQYQTAHAYLALAYDKLKDADRTRDSLRRIVQAERVERKFGAIAFPPDVRAAVLNLAGRVLPAGDVETLRTSPPRAGAPASSPAGPAASSPPVTTTTTTTRPSGSVTPPSQPATTPAVPAQKPATQPQPAQTQPAQPRPAQTQPTQPPQTQPAQTQPAQPRPVPSNQQPATSNPSPSTATPPRTTTTTTPPRTTPTPPPTITAGEIATRMLAGERALTASNLTEARRIYRELLNANGVPRETLIRVAEGFYRARDFGGALAAFDRAGGLRRGEEPYRYYIAVAAYETGQHERARRELAAALPFIEITPDVARYKAKIEGAQN